MALGTMAAAASTACEEGEDVGEVHALRHVLDLRIDGLQVPSDLPPRSVFQETSRHPHAPPGVF